MNIKAKLRIGFTVLLLLMLGITSFGYGRLNQMNGSLKHFYDNRFEKVRVTLAVLGEVNASARVINDIVLEDESPADGVKELTDRLTSAGEQYKTLTKMELEPEEQDIVDGILKSADGYRRSLQSFIQLVNEGKLDAAKVLYTDSLRGEQRLIIDSMDSLVKYEETAMKQEMIKAKQEYKQSVQMVAIFTIAGLLIGFLIVMWVFPSITKGLNLLGRMADRFEKGRLRGFAHFDVNSKDELGELATIFKRIALDLQAKKEREAILSGIQHRQARMNGQIARMTELLQQGSDPKLVAQAFLSEFSPILGASHGLLYLKGISPDGDRLELTAAYASHGEHMTTSGNAVPEYIRAGEGLAGQCYLDGKSIYLTDIPGGYVTICSGLGGTEPRALVIQPITYENSVIGVIEMAALTDFSPDNRELLVFLCDKLGTIVSSIHSRQRVEELLRESQAMTEELQEQSEELIRQQEELRETNDKLEEQRNDLKKSELKLQQQQEELEHANRELTTKTLALEDQVDRVEQTSSLIAQANSELERQALQLALTSKYRSEFLANMSHELRTPLNSLLILSEFLSENKEGNLTDKQLEYMRTIHYSGNDLLKMIDEILDLSKVDSGKMDILPEWTVLQDMTQFLEHTYQPMAQQKGIGFKIETSPDVPGALWTDGHRLKQIMRNLLSNAIKFTEHGSVNLTIRKPNEQELKSSERQDQTGYVALSVKDTGIGISSDKSELIFEAFRQADGTTSRKYGGTGLGLTISKELARLLGGWIHLETELGQGSTFTLVLPERIPFSA
jgi:signal transduction histidine kinase